MINRLRSVAGDGHPAAGESPRRGEPAPLPDWKQLLGAVEQTIVKYPAAALATAFFVGVAVAWWIKRK